MLDRVICGQDYFSFARTTASRRDFLTWKVGRDAFLFSFYFIAKPARTSSVAEPLLIFINRQTIQASQTR